MKENEVMNIKKVIADSQRAKKEIKKISKIISKAEDNRIFIRNKVVNLIDRINLEILDLEYDSFRNSAYYKELYSYFLDELRDILSIVGDKNDRSK